LADLTSRISRLISIAVVTIAITLKTHNECNGHLIAPDAVVSFAVNYIMIAVTAKAGYSVSKPGTGRCFTPGSGKEPH
jgi:hypothetical protein